MLRGIAILLVLGHHFAHYQIWQQVGWTGVELFFVLSGFLISRLLFKDFLQTGGINLRRFWTRRALKIVPPLYVMLAVIGIVLLYFHSHVWKVFAASAFFFRNYLPSTADGTGLLIHTWTLGVEEHFYLTLPILLLLLIRLRPRDPFSSIPTLFLIVAPVCLVLRLLSHSAEAHATHLRIDSLFAGVTLGYLYDFRPEWFRRIAFSWSPALALLLWLPAFILKPNSRFMQTWGIAALYIASALLLSWCFARDAHPMWQRMPIKVIAEIGVYSYSVYLWYVPVAVVFSTLPPTLFNFWAGVCIAISVGIVMAKLIEIPVARFRDSLSQRTTVQPLRIRLQPDSASTPVQP